LEVDSRTPRDGGQREAPIIHIFSPELLFTTTYLNNIEGKAWTMRLPGLDPWRIKKMTPASSNSFRLRIMAVGDFWNMSPIAFHPIIASSLISLSPYLKIIQRNNLAYNPRYVL
jgi:hypothetical protein